jgi:hypothetical protein
MGVFELIAGSELDVYLEVCGLLEATSGIPHHDYDAVFLVNSEHALELLATRFKPDVHHSIFADFGPRIQ